MRRFFKKCALCGKAPVLCECHIKPLSPSPGWALFRPDGTLKSVFGPGAMFPEWEESILCSAWDELKPEDYQAAGTPVGYAVAEARRRGYRVVAVTITPNTERTDEK